MPTATAGKFECVGQMINLGGRLVPMELFYTLIVGAAIMALVILGVLFWFGRSGKPTKTNAEKKPRSAKPQRRRARKK